MTNLADQMAEVFKSGFDAGLAHADITRMDQGGSYTKAEVNYRPADSGDHCGICDHFDQNKCDIVSGRISETNVCDKYEAGDQSEEPTDSTDTAEPADSSQSASQPTTG